MATLPPPNIFDSAAIVERPADEAAAVQSSQAPAAAADFSGIDCIGEIFVGASKLEQPEIWFENTAYPREDELLYEVLGAMDNPHERNLPDVPQGLVDEMEPMPLFLRQAV